jgi:hypothetical protein
MNVSEIADQLQVALTEAKTAHAKVEKLKADFNAQISPLEELATKAAEAVHQLMTQYQRETGGLPWARTEKRGTRAPRAPQKKREPIVNIDIQMRKAYTTAKKGGASEKDAKKAGEAAGKKAAEKLGYAGALPTPAYTK